MNFNECLKSSYKILFLKLAFFCFLREEFEFIDPFKIYCNWDVLFVASFPNCKLDAKIRPNTFILESKISFPGQTFSSLNDCYYISMVYNVFSYQITMKIYVLSS